MAHHTKAKVKRQKAKEKKADGATVRELQPSVKSPTLARRLILLLPFAFLLLPFPVLLYHWAVAGARRPCARFAWPTQESLWPKTCPRGKSSNNSSSGSTILRVCCNRTPRACTPSSGAWA